MNFFGGIGKHSTEEEEPARITGLSQTVNLFEAPQSQSHVAFHDCGRLRADSHHNPHLTVPDDDDKWRR